jgi:hypothetical protein
MLIVYVDNNGRKEERFTVHCVDDLDEYLDDETTRVWEKSFATAEGLGRAFKSYANGGPFVAGGKRCRA